MKQKKRKRWNNAPSKGGALLRAHVRRIILIAFGGLAVIAAATTLFLTLRTRTIIVALPELSAQARAEYENFVTRFEAGNQKLHVRLLFSEAAAYDPAALIRLKRPPDVVEWSPGFELRKAAQAGLLIPIDTGSALLGIDSYPEALKKEITVNGKAYLLPVSVDPWLMMYDQEFLRSIGAGVPGTWQAFLSFADAARKRGLVPVALAGLEPAFRAAWAEKLVEGPLGADAYRAFVAGETTFTEGPVASALAQFPSLQAGLIFQRGSFSFNASDAIALLLSGKAAATYVPMSDPRRRALASLGRFSYSRFPDFPGRSEYSVRADVIGYAIPRKAREARSAVRLLNALSNRETQSRFSAARGVTAAFIGAPVADPADAMAARALRNASLVMNGSLGDMQPELSTAFSKSLELLLRSPKETNTILEGTERARLGAKARN